MALSPPVSQGFSVSPILGQTLASERPLPKAWHQMVREIARPRRPESARWTVHLQVLLRPPATRPRGAWGPAAAAPEADPEPRPHLAHQPLPVALGPIAVHVPSGLREQAARPPPFSSSGSCRRRHHPGPAQPREGRAPPSLRAAASRDRPRRCLHVSLRGGKGGGAGLQPLPYSGSGPSPAATPRGPQATSCVS